MKKKIVMVAMVTPFDALHRIDDEAVIRICHHLISNRVDGIVVAGTTGEAASLSFEERSHLLKLIKSVCDSKAEVWMGCGTNNADETLKYCWQAEELGADGVMLITPYYVRPSQKGLKEYFSFVLSKVKLPVMLYNVPKRTAVHLEAKTFIELAHKHSNLVMLKQAEKDKEGTLRILSETDCKVLCGDDFWYDEALEWGMDGIVSVAGHLGAHLIHQMNTYHLISIHSQKTIDEFKRLSRMCFLVSSPSDIKTMLHMKGLCLDEVRLPLTKLDEEEKKRIKDFLKTFS